MAEARVGTGAREGDGEASGPLATDGLASEPDSLVRLEWFKSRFEAEAAKVFLERKGIRVSLTPEGLGKPDGPAYLEVLAATAERAKRLLERRKK